MEVFFLRHGETAWNAERRIQGSTSDIDLTPSGVRAAEAVRDVMASRGLTFDRIYSSPYRRALHTAQIVADGFGLAPLTDERLREMSFGKYEGTFYCEGRFADDNIRACFVDPPSYVATDGAESFDEVARRVRSFFDDTLAPLSGQVGRVLAVAHGGVLRTVLRLATGRALADYWKGAQPNCCAHVVDFRNGAVSLVSRAVTFSE